MEPNAEAYREQLEADEELAIVLQTPAVVRAYYDGLGLKKTRRTQVRVNGDTFSAGKRDGYGFGRGDRLEE